MSEGTCSVDGCERPARCRGLCSLDYNRWLRDPQRPRRPSDEERFWMRVDKNGPNGCWLWTGAIHVAGYGHVSGRRSGRSDLAHRYAYELLVGHVPEGFHLDHLCRVPHCVKAIVDEYGPAHLEAVTPAENARRSEPAQRRHCPKGHAYDEANTYWSSKGTRTCRTCHRLAERTRQRRVAELERAQKEKSR